MINLHGTIYENQCPRCKKQYTLEYIQNSPRKVPLCEKCNIPVRPLISLFGEMVDWRFPRQTRFCFWEPPWIPMSSAIT